MRIMRLHKRSTNNKDGKKKGSCVKLKPCGMEAACSQIDKHTYICICPHDYSQPNEELKCLNRPTVPLVPRPRTNLSIIINEPRPTPSPIASNTTWYGNRTVQTPISPTFNQTTRPFVPQDKQLSVDILGVVVRANLLILAAIIATVVSMLFILAMCWSRKSSSCCKRKVTKNNSPVPLYKNVIQDESFAINPIYTSPPAPEEKILVPHLSKKSITAMEEIGQGFFGKVYKAILTHTDGKIEMVAIKVMKESANPEAKEDFKRETEIMTYFRHPNILSLLGVCSEADVSCPWMIFEFMAYGDLTEVLRNSTDEFTSYSFHLPVLDWEALLKISLQIASGMKYLASQRFIHRDLACRNCLVGFNLNVKIADFGMSRDIYTSDYYKMGVNRMLPVRWMSPECIVYGKFTLESDVWSYGVVLWEIYSLGKQPYYGYSNDEALKMIQEGVLLEIPMNCPPLICVLMNGCWKTDPKERPRFADVHDRLKNAAKRAELDSPLPRPPALPAIVDHLSLKKAASEELLDDEDYLRPDRPVGYDDVEYIEYDVGAANER